MINKIEASFSSRFDQLTSKNIALTQESIDSFAEGLPHAHTQINEIASGQKVQLSPAKMPRLINPIDQIIEQSIKESFGETDLLKDYQWPNRKTEVSVNEEGYKIKSKILKDALKDIPAFSTQENVMRSISLALVQIADELHQAGLPIMAMVNLDKAQEVFEVLVNVNPITSIPKCFYELYTGETLSGAMLSESDKILNGIELLAAGLPLKVLLNSKILNAIPANLYNNKITKNVLEEIGKTYTLLVDSARKLGINPTKIYTKTIKYSDHALEQATKRGIPKSWAEKAIQKGQRYYDHQNKSVVHVLQDSLKSGQSLGVARDAQSGVVKTIMKMKNFNPQNAVLKGTDKIRYELLP